MSKALEIAEAIIEEAKNDGYNFIATGCTKENGGTLYKIHTTHDKGVTKSKLYAKSPEDAIRVVQKGYGGPDSAHKIVEAIINEVSIKKWKEAAANVLPKRKEDAEVARTSAEKGWDEYDRAARKYPEDEPALYRLAQANDEEAQKVEDRADHAYSVTRLRVNDKANANKAIKAARKVQDKREDEFSKNLDKRTFLRTGKADQLVSADPVKSRADEALEIAEAIINLVNEGDNLRDVVKRARRSGKVDNTKGAELEKRAMRVPADNDYYEDEEGNNVYNLHGKPVSKTDLGTHLNDQRHYSKGRDEEELWNKRRNDEVRGYPQATAKTIKKHNKTNEALELAEAIINEVSDELKKRAQQKADDNIRDARADLENKLVDINSENPSVTQEDVNKAKLNVQKQVGRASKLDDAIMKHDLAKMQGKIKPVSNKTNEALQLAEAICDFADNLFELDYEQKQDISPNKIKKTKKDKNGEKVEVVSVADELFPYEGTAKQQFNQKILAKINDMIEGTGSLEDLIQFVRAGAKVKKTVNEG